MILSELLRRIWYVIHRRRLERELQEEMEAHREMMVDPRRFGSALSLRERARDVWEWNWLEQLLQDVFYGVQILWKSPGLSGTAAILIALVIGGNAAIYSMIHSLITRQAPGVHAERLVTISFPGTRHATFDAFTGRVMSSPNIRNLQTMSGLICILAPRGA